MQFGIFDKTLLRITKSLAKLWNDKLWWFAAADLLEEEGNNAAIFFRKIGNNFGKLYLYYSHKKKRRGRHHTYWWLRPSATICNTYKFSWFSTRDCVESTEIEYLPDSQRTCTPDDYPQVIEKNPKVERLFYWELGKNHD